MQDSRNLCDYFDQNKETPVSDFTTRSFLWIEVTHPSEEKAKTSLSNTPVESFSVLMERITSLYEIGVDNWKTSEPQVLKTSNSMLGLKNWQMIGQFLGCFNF